MLRGLSLTQPWASLVSIQAKKIETRSWATSYTGWLAIHASKQFPMDCQYLTLREPFRGALVAGGLEESEKLSRGAIVAVAKLVRCLPTTECAAIWTLPKTVRPYTWTIWVRRSYFAVPEPEWTFGDYSSDRFAWLLDDAHRLPEPIPWKGALGLWRLPPDVEQRIREQLPAVRW